MSTLKEQMQSDLQLVGITPKTQQVYLREVSNFENYFEKSPDLLGEKEVKEVIFSTKGSLCNKHRAAIVLSKSAIPYIPQ